MKLTDISPAIALTPLDGRYHKQTADLVEYLSEPALNRERIHVEVEWMILLANGFDGNGNQPIVEGVQPFTEAEIAFLRAIPEQFGAEGIAAHAAHEAVTHHDVKAVEYYIDDQIDKAAAVLGPDTQLNERIKTLVHFACHLRGHQQPVHGAVRQAGDGTGPGCPRSARSSTIWPPRPRTIGTCRCSR